MACVTFALVYSVLAKTDKETTRAKKSFMKFSLYQSQTAVTRHHEALSLISSDLQPHSSQRDFAGFLYLFVHVPLLGLSFSHREEKSS